MACQQNQVRRKYVNQHYLIMIIFYQLMYMIYVDNDNEQYMYIFIIYYVTQYGVSRTNA